MKLIDLLVKELPNRGGWPEGAECAIQDADMQVCFSKTIDGLSINSAGTDWLNGTWYGGWSNPYMDTLSEDHGTAIITRAQYEAALSKNDGWIEWGGGECPVEAGSLVDIRDGDGYEWHGVKAATKDEYSDAAGTFWEHKGSPNNNIIAYRLHKPDINSRANDDRMEQDLNECIGQDVDMPEWSGDGLPPVGCECETIHRSCDSWQPIKVIAVNDGAVFGFWVSGNTPCALPVEVYQFRPLRTEAEKAREKLAASLHIAAGASPIELNGIGRLYFKLADAIISGSVFGTTFKAGK